MLESTVATQEKTSVKYCKGNRTECLSRATLSISAGKGTATNYSTATNQY